MSWRRVETNLLRLAPTAWAALALALAAGPAAGAVAGAAATGTLYVSPGGSDLAACTQVATCLSFGRAYRLALPGQVVEVAAGTYAAQTIPLDASKTSLADVVIRPAAGAAVTVAGAVNVYGRHVELRDMTFAGGWYARQGADSVTFRNIVAKLIGVQSARRISVLGGEVGPWLATGNGDPKIAKSSASSTIVPADILIDGTRFHDILRPPGSGYHIECLQIGAAINLTIRNSSFEGCATHAVFVSSWGRGYTLRNVTIENNTFGPTPDGYHTAKINVAATGEPCQACVIRGNVSAEPIAVNVERSGSTITVSGNRMSSADLAAPGWCDHGLYGVVWDGNVFASRPTCGVNATLGP